MSFSAVKTSYFYEASPPTLSGPHAAWNLCRPQELPLSHDHCDEFFTAMRDLVFENRHLSSSSSHRALSLTPSVSSSTSNEHPDAKHAGGYGEGKERAGINVVNK